MERLSHSLPSNAHRLLGELTGASRFRSLEFMPKVAITDYSFKPIDIEKEILEPLGCEVVLAKGRSAPELMEVVADADHVITQFALVTAEVIGAMKNVRVIVRSGIGYDNVDLEAAKAKGI